ncbi:hypothetical protein ACH5RR_006585, partial [Cinchona calisaya]
MTPEPGFKFKPRQSLMYYGLAEVETSGKGSSWKIPSSPDEYNKWAEKNRFQIGDFIVMEYDANSDSVLEVVEADYKSCNKSNPIKAFHDGKTKIQLDRSGPFYFISGAENHCQKGQKLVVEVLSAKHASSGPAPAPSSAGNYSPATAPANDGHSLQLGTMSVIALMVGCLAAFAL